MYDVVETEDGPEIHGHMPDTEKIITAVLIVAFWPLGLYYWSKSAEQADDKAQVEYDRDQAKP